MMKYIYISAVLIFDKVSVEKKGKKSTNQSGSLLILVLWALFFLTSLALTAGVYVSGGLAIAKEIKGRTSARALALTGVERAIMEVMVDTNWWDGVEETWSKGSSVHNDWKIENGFYIVCSSTDALNKNLDSIQKIGKNEFLGLEDEERRVNINTASAGLLSALIEIVCRVDSMSASEISASIIDWRDEDDIVTPGGAENSYYLRMGYSCANRQFYSVHELLLVKGIKPEIYQQLMPYITIFGSGKININTADEKVLFAAIYASSGMARNECQTLAQKIVRLRQNGKVFDSSDAFAIIKRLEENFTLNPVEKSALGAFLGSGMVTVKSSCFRGISTGLAGSNGKEFSKKTVNFVINRTGRILLWNED